MEKKNKRKSSVLLILLLLVAVVGVVSYTYARYAASASAEDTIDAAAFAVTVNDADIVAGETATIALTDAESDYVVDGKIAPDSTFYFDIEIDPTGSETALSYTINNVSLENTSASNITVAITGYSLDGGATITSSSTGEVSGTIALESQSAAMTSTSTVTVRIYAKWTSNDTNTEYDTEAQATTFTGSADVTVQQYLG